MLWLTKNILNLPASFGVAFAVSFAVHPLAS